MHLLKHAVLTLCCITVSIVSHSRSFKPEISIKSLTVNPIMAANPQEWGLAAVSMSAETIEPYPPVYTKLVVQIKQAGKSVCGNNPPVGILVAPFTTRTFTMTELAQPLSICPILKAGAYTICFQFFNDKNDPISIESRREFSVEETVSAPVTYSPPKNVSPADKKTFSVAEVKQPIKFSRLPVSPTPKGVITYRVQMWLVAVGQEPAQAMQANQPVFSKDVKEATETTLTSAFPTTADGPNERVYVWTVQALNSEGQPVGGNNGYSKPFALVVSDYIIRIKDIQVNCTATPGVYSFSYIVANVNAGPAKLTNFAITSSLPAGATLTSFTPPINTTIPAGNQITITGTITASPSLSNICIGAEITDVANTFNKASKDTCTVVAPCKCTACDPKNINIAITPTTNIVVNANNTITLNQPITVTTTPAKTVKSVRAELMYFEFVPESEDCLPCNKDSKTYGNIDNGTLAATTGIGSGTHSLLWAFFPYKNFTTANNASITITLPPAVKCCGATVRWCIRYVITFNDCTVCNKLVCYEKKKDGCATGTGTGTGTGNPNPNNN